MLSLCFCSESFFHFPSQCYSSLFFLEIFRTPCLWTLTWALWKCLLKNLNTTIPCFSEKVAYFGKQLQMSETWSLQFFRGTLSLYQSHLYQLQETWGESLGWEDCPEEGMATNSSIHAWIPWTGRLQSTVLQSLTQWKQLSTHTFI